jgi:hypothetical protein
MEPDDELPPEDKVMLPDGSMFDMASLRFNKDEREVIARGVTAWKNKKENAARSWEEWVEIGWCLHTARREIVRRVNKPNGIKFNRVMALWLEREGLEDTDKGARSRMLKIMDNLPAISAWHATLPIGQRVHCNAPDTVLRQYNNFLKTGLEKPAEKLTGKDLAIEELSEKLDELTAERDGYRKRAETAEWKLAYAEGEFLRIRNAMTLDERLRFFSKKRGRKGNTNDG